jgi:hypothetical protein
MIPAPTTSGSRDESIIRLASFRSKRHFHSCPGAHRTFAAALAFLMAFAASACAASQDNDIEANGAWSDSFDASPQAPLRNQAFTLEL